MSRFVWLVWALMRRQWLVVQSYRWAVVGALLLQIPHVVMLLMLGRYFEQRGAGSRYFAFTMTGSALLVFASRIVGGTARALREMQQTGNGQIFFLAPVKPWQVVLGLSLSVWPRANAELVVTLLLAQVLGAGFELEWAAALWTWLLALFSLTPLALLAAAGVLWLRQRDLVTLALGTAGYVLSGVYYPLAVLPAGLQGAAHLLPTTHLLALGRASLMGYEMPSVHVLGALVLGGVGWPLCAWLLIVALRRRAEGGDLMTY